MMVIVLGLWLVDLAPKMPRSRTKKTTTYNNSTWRENTSLQCEWKHRDLYRQQSLSCDLKEISDMYVYLLTEVAAYRNLWVIGRDFFPPNRWSHLIICMDLFFLMWQGLCRYLFYKTGVRFWKKKNFFEEVRLYHRSLDLYRA